MLYGLLQMFKRCSQFQQRLKTLAVERQEMLRLLHQPGLSWFQFYLIEVTKMKQIH